MTEIFRVGLTRDCLRPDGRVPVFDPSALDSLKNEPSTDECFRRIAEDAFASVVAVARGVAPASVVNREALDHPAFTAALAARRLGRATGAN